MAVLKRYNGTTWETPVLYRYTGTTWECVDLNRYTGSAWEDVQTACAEYVPPVEFDPEAITGLVGWWKADSIAQADNTSVATWQDSSTNNRDLTGNGDPRYRTGIINGQPAIRMDDDYFTNTFGITASQPNTVFIVASQEGESYRYIMDGNGSSNRQGFGRFLPDGPAWPSMDLYAGTNLFSSQTVPTGIHVWTCRFNGVNSFIRKDGVQTAAGDAGSQSPAGIVLGANFSGGERMVGYLAEVLFYNAALSSTDRDAVEAYLMDKYGL